MSSDSMRLGSVMHAVNLMNTPISSLMTFERMDGRTNKGKAQKTAISNLKLYIYEDEIAKVSEMHANFLKCKSARFIMDNAQFIEKYGIAEIRNDRYPENKLFMKFKPDIVGPDYIADYKTMGSFKTDENIKQSVRAGDYVFQAACYQELDNILYQNKRTDSVFIFQETIAPYGCRVVKVPEDLMEIGRWRLDFAMKKYLKAHNSKLSGDQSSSDPNDHEITTLDIPYY